MENKMKAERGPPKKRGRKPIDPEVAAARAKAKAEGPPGKRGRPAKDSKKDEEK